MQPTALARPFLRSTSVSPDGKVHQIRISADCSIQEAALACLLDPLFLRREFGSGDSAAATSSSAVANGVHVPEREVKAVRIRHLRLDMAGGLAAACMYVHVGRFRRVCSCGFALPTSPAAPGEK